MVHHIIDEGFWRRAVIHLVTNVEDDSLKEKKIVLDPTDAVRFPLTHFTHIFSNTSYIVDSSSSQVEFHLFVSVDCPLTDDELRDIISKPGDEDNSYVKELWFRGAHVFNLDSIRQIQEWMDAMAPTLMDKFPVAAMWCDLASERRRLMLQRRMVLGWSRQVIMLIRMDTCDRRVIFWTRKK